MPDVATTLDDELALLEAIRRGVERELHEGDSPIRAYLDATTFHIRRGLPSKPGTSSDDATCTSFCLFYLLNAGLAGPGAAPGRSRGFTQDEVAQIAEAAERAFRESHVARGKTRIGPLPNAYNSSIQLAGFLFAYRQLGREPAAETISQAVAVVEKLEDLATRNDWRIPAPASDGVERNSSYLRFWACIALAEIGELKSLSATGKAKCAELLKRLVDSAERDLASSIAYHHASLTSRFDVIDAAYSAVTAVRFESSPEATGLARHLFDIIFANYFGDGCFTPSAPVLADSQNFSLQCSTAEILALMVTLKPGVCFTNKGDLAWDKWEPLAQTVAWLSRHRMDHDGAPGWRSEADGPLGHPNAFMTASALSFLVGFSSVLDEVGASRASGALGVETFAPDPKLKKYEYPADLGDIITHNIIRPIRNQDLKRLASYSMILYGPPGTSKTTIAKKLAHDLGWPLLELNQGVFLRDGLYGVNAQAERVFKLLRFLKDTVVLFDEIEELVERRDPARDAVTPPDKLSRLLTTAMLPRIHDLRDRKRIVFIFATNHVELIDSAIMRLGRFDIVQVVMPPNEPERDRILSLLLDDFKVGADVRKAFDQANAAGLTTRFGYKDLEGVVRQVQIAVLVNGLPPTKDLITNTIKRYKNAVDAIKFEQYEATRERDRP